MPSLHQDEERKKWRQQQQPNIWMEMRRFCDGKKREIIFRMLISIFNGTPTTQCGRRTQNKWERMRERRKKWMKNSTRIVWVTMIFRWSDLVSNSVSSHIFKTIAYLARKATIAMAFMLVYTHAQTARARTHTQTHVVPFCLSNLYICMC